MPDRIRLSMLREENASTTLIFYQTWSTSPSLPLPCFLCPAICRWTHQVLEDAPLLLRRLWYDLRRGDTRVLGALIRGGVMLQLFVVALYIISPVSDACEQNFCRGRVRCKAVLDFPPFSGAAKPCALGFTRGNGVDLRTGSVLSSVNRHRPGRKASTEGRRLPRC